jgi:hypothetical protein
MKIKDYVALFALDGVWRKKRAEKKIFFTNKSLRTRAVIMRNYIVPLWGNEDPRKLTVKIIDLAMEGITSKLTERPSRGPPETGFCWYSQSFISTSSRRTGQPLRPDPPAKLARPAYRPITA